MSEANCSQAPGSASYSAELVAKLRADADSWEKCADALGFINDEGKKRTEERIAYLRASADEIERLVSVIKHQAGYSATLQNTDAAQRRAAIDAAFVRAGHKPENTDCDHLQYDSTKHGRYCPCGTCMWDAGD